MTNDEAKAIIRKEYLCVDRDCDIERSCGKCDLMMPSKEPILQAYKMAIQALEQEPCEDCISRVELLKAIDTWDKFGLDDTNHLFRLDNLSLPYYVPYIHYDDVIKCIKGMPKAEQESTGWIPCSERLPENRNQEVLISLEWGIDIGRYSDGEWHSEWVNRFDDGNVLAWMPLPEPYKESEG